MIGFEIDKKHLIDYEESFVTTLVCIGEKSPFVLNQMKPVAWREIDIKDEPQVSIEKLIEVSLKSLNFDLSLSNEKLIKGKLYGYEQKELNYFVWNILSDAEVINTYAKYYYVINTLTKDTICQELIFDHESASPALLNYVEDEYINQWTGSLFKNMPKVILGLEAVSFGCPRIKFLEVNKQDIDIQCDNRH